MNRAELFQNCKLHAAGRGGVIAVLILSGVFLITESAVAEENRIHRFSILHTNDEHGYLLPLPLVDYHSDQPDPSVGGFARLATKVDSIRDVKSEIDEPVYLLSGGDIMGGPPMSFLSMAKIAPEIMVMQEIGYDLITIGNHEFDYGPEKLAAYLEYAGYPDAHQETVFMGSNTYPPQDHPLYEMEIPRNHIKETDEGLRIGFLGLIGEGAEQSATLTDPVDFTAPIEEAADQVEELKQENVDVIIAVTHSGVYEDRQLAEQVDEIDLIVGGHSHDALYEPVIVNETPIVQAGNYLRYLGQLELEYNEDRERLSILNEEDGVPYLHEIDDDLSEHEGIKELVLAYKDTLNSYLSEWTDNRFEDISEPIARSQFILDRDPALTETQLGNFVTDAMRLQTGEITGRPVDFAFQADGALRDIMHRGSTTEREDEVWFNDLVATVGLGSGLDERPGYPIVSAYLTGEEVRRVMEVSLLLSELFGEAYFLQASGLRMEYDHDRAIVLTIPFLDMPVPSNRGVLQVERYTGEGMQNDEQFEIIERGEEDRLYHIVADYYLASFLPLVGDVVPQLELILKDEDGNEIEVEDAIVEREPDQELKMWETVVEYATSFNKGNYNLPEIPAVYETTGERLIPQTTIPIWIWPLAGLLLLIILVLILIRLFRQRKKGSR